MKNELGISGRCGFALLAVAVLGLPVALFAGGIDLPVFVAVSCVWLLVSVMLILGESITEVTIWKTSIKRDVKAAQEARAETEAIRDQLRDVVRLVIENNYILASGSDLARAGHPSVQRVHSNLDALTEKMEIDPQKLAAWQEEMRQLMRQPPIAGVQNG